VQKTAAQVVIAIGEYAAAVVPALDQVAVDADPVVARAGVQALAALGAYAVAGLPTLSESLDHDDLGVRYYAGDGLSRVDSQMRSAARAIQRLAVRYSDESAAAVRDLASALKEDRTRFRERAVLTLASIGPTGREQVDRLPPGPPDLQTVRVLGDISRFATAAVPSLVEALADPDYPGVRAEAGELDVAIGSAPLLAALTDDRQDVRASSAQALRDTSTVVTRALSALKGAPRDDIFVRQATRSALRTIDAYSADAVPALLAAVKDEDPGVRRVAVQTLGQLGPQARRSPTSSICCGPTGSTCSPRPRWPWGRSARSPRPPSRRSPRPCSTPTRPSAIGQRARSACSDPTPDPRFPISRRLWGGVTAPCATKPRAPCRPSIPRARRAIL
jgi:HEAT repeat protein